LALRLFEYRITVHERFGMSAPQATMHPYRQTHISVRGGALQSGI
jgi:hypothetical protein